MLLGLYVQYLINAWLKLLAKFLSLKRKPIIILILSGFSLFWTAGLDKTAQISCIFCKHRQTLHTI